MNFDRTLSTIFFGVTVTAGTCGLLYIYYKHLQRNVERQHYVEDEVLNQVTREVIVPKDVVPGLIGPSGSNVKSIQKDSNTHISYSDNLSRRNANGDRIFLIRGTSENVAIAKDIIENFIRSQPSVLEIKIKIPQAATGRVIGRNGETIRCIQDQSKARVVVDSLRRDYDDNEFEAEEDTKILVEIRGTEEQINTARYLIEEKVKETEIMRKRIKMNAARRAPRRPGADNAVMKENIMEVFVSCVINPNKFWIQQASKESIRLDKLGEQMNMFYKEENKGQYGPGVTDFKVNDFVAAQFTADNKYYRGKITEISETGAQIFFLDYGDNEVVNLKDIRRLRLDFLDILQIQAIKATLNLEPSSLDKNWDESVNSQLCDLTYAAQWHSLLAKNRGYIKDPEDEHNDILWIELLDKDLNIGLELVRRGHAKVKDNK